MRKIGFHVNQLFADNQYKPLLQRLNAVDVRLNNPAASEHVPDVEREIRALKEHVREAINNTPYTYFPRGW